MLPFYQFIDYVKVQKKCKKLLEQGINLPYGVGFNQERDPGSSFNYYYSMEQVFYLITYTCSINIYIYI